MDTTLPSYHLRRSCQILYGTGTIEEHQQRLNATRFLNKTDPTAASILSLYFGYIWDGVMKLWNQIGYIVAGFPYLLYRIGLSVDPSARTTYNAVAGVIIVVQSFIILGWLFQVITGRSVQD